MFEIKICGVKLNSDIDAVAESAQLHGCKAAIGLNFFANSVRFVDPDASLTRDLSEHAAELGLVRIGVFVNQTPDQIQRTVNTVGLDVVQLHGDESLKSAQQLMAASHRVIRAIKLPTVALDIDHIRQKTAPWLDIGCHVLLDADAGAAHGGSGKTLDWKIVAAWAAELAAKSTTGSVAANPSPPWTLAGGLTPENLAQAIRVSTAQSVDTASGVEEQRGTKSPHRIDQFFKAMP